MATVTASKMSLSQEEEAKLKSLSDSDWQDLLRDLKPTAAKSLARQVGRSEPAASISRPRSSFTTVDYERKKRDARARSAAITVAGRDIGRIPMVKDLERRMEAKTSLLAHMESYHSHLFTCRWASYHYALIAKAEMAVLEGGWFAMAVPRGGGKSTICQCVAEWAVLHGHKLWPVLIGATSDLGETYLKNVKQELLHNRLLLEDFPEVVYPIVQLSDEPRKAKGQACLGFRTGIEWGSEKIVMPSLEPSYWAEWAGKNFTDNGVALPAEVGGSRITSHGLTGSFRGLNDRTVTLKSIRPDIAIPDDSQTRESARSYVQSQYRAAIIKGDIAYLNGPGNPMSVLLPCTVIYRGDLADQMLDRNLSPEFRGERHKMVNSFPVNVERWDEYAELRRTCLRLNESLERCNEFYREHREEMDAGASVSWEDRFPSDCVSAIQFAMNLKIRDEESFWAEAQNEPSSSQETDAIHATPLQIIAKQHHCDRKVFPMFVEHLAAGIDVQQRMLFWTVAGASSQLEVAISDYGTFPDQRRSFFGYREDGLKCLDDVFPGERLEVQLYKAIQAMVAELATSTYLRDDGVELKIGRILVDCGWLPDVVIKACRESPFSNVVLPSQGLSVMAKDEPLSLRKKKQGEKYGCEWIVKPKPGMATIRYAQVNANYWKTQLHAGFKTHSGAGSVSLWKERPERHRMYAEHLNGETPVRTTVKERVVDEWNEKPAKPDNHLLDTSVLALAGLSMQGCAIPSGQETDHVRRREPRRISSKSINKRR